MRSKSYKINISPIGWRRVSRNYSRYYDPHNRDIISFGLYLAQQHNDEPFFTKPVKVDITFYMPMSLLLKDRVQSQYHSTTPYLDNLYKFLLDAMKNVVIADDRVICSLSMKKVYDKEPRTELTITEVE